MGGVTTLGGNIHSITIMEGTVDIGSLDANDVVEAGTISCPGVKEGDVVIPIKPTLTSGIAVVQARVTADDTVAMQCVNPTGGAVNPSSETFKFLVIRPENPNDLASQVLT